MAGLSLGLAAATAEVGLRVLSHHDVDGNLRVGDLWLRPFRPPLEVIRPYVKRILEDPSLYIRYDPDLGWSIRPSAKSADGMYFSNAQGVRTGPNQKPTSAAPVPGTVRIALYGDSFAHSNDVHFEESWGAMLQGNLDEAGMRAEVINQGTPGYGMDQAYLRWRKEGRPLAPDIVVFAFQSSDAKRNLNLLRVLYSPDTGLHFSKPRFVLDGDGLRLVNVPTLRPERIGEVLSDFEQWELSPHEFYYQPANYADSVLYRSRLLCFLSSGVGTLFSQRRPYASFFSEGSESREITWRIIERFEREVRAEGSEFVIVHIPTRKRLSRMSWGLDLRYRDLLDALIARYDVADPTDGLMAALKIHGMEPLRAGGGHYSGIANRAIADAAATTLIRRHNRIR
jgi:hypothetical protein